MKIWLFSNDRKRGRHYYLITPLKKAGFEVEFNNSVIDFFKSRHLFEQCVFVGIGRNTIIQFLIIRLFASTPLIIRLGGRRLEAPKESLRILIEKRGFLRALLFSSRLFFIYLGTELANGFICMSRQSCREAKELDGLKQPCVVIPQYRQDLIEWNQNYSKKLTQHLSILTIANLKYRSKLNGLLTIIDFLDRISLQKNIDIEYTIAGSDQFFKQELIEKISQIRSNRLKIQFLGHVDRPEKIYMNNNLFIYNSEFEGLPNVLMEAMCFGCALLLNDYPGFKEYFQKDRNAIYYHPKYEDFQYAFEKILYRLKDISKNNIDDFKQVFGLEKIAEYAKKLKELK